MSNVKALPAAKTAAAKPARSDSEFRRSMRLINRFIAGQRGVFGMAMFMLILESLTSIGAKFPLSWLLDYLKDGPPQLARDIAKAFELLPPAVPAAITGFFLGLTTDEVLIFLSIAILVTALANSASDSFSEIYLVKGGRLLGFKLRDQLYAHLQKLSLAFFGQQRTGDLLARVTGDVTALEDFAVKSLKDIAGSVFLIVLTLVVLFVQDWRMGVIALVTVPILSLASNYFADRIKAASKKQRAREGELAASAQEMLTSIRVIQIYGNAGDQQKKFATTSRQAMDVAVQVGRLTAWFGGVISLLQSVVLVIIVWVAVALVGQGAISLGTTVLFIGLIQDLFKPTKRIIKQWNEVGKIMASAERIGDILDRKPAVADAPGAVPAPALRGNIEFNHVSFAYMVEAEDSAKDGGVQQLRMALRDVSFSISPGEVVALVGSSGAGKSTIVQLLPRLYDPHSGQVLIDGHDIREFTLDSLRSRMSMVLQEAILFAGTVAENIAYGRPDATREEIIAAAMQASAHEFIEKLPNGYDTMLSERASNLSGGQRQRIAIARAFVRNTPILILDEPTTGLDAESTDLVLHALRALMKGKATVIISHDLNLIRQADKIVVITQGEIAQVGTHKELLRRGGLYAELYHKQFDRAVEEQAQPKPAIPVPAMEEDDEAPSISPKLFQTMMLQALPAPASIKAFQTMSMPAVSAPRPAPAPAAATPAPAAATPAATSAPAAVPAAAPARPATPVAAPAPVAKPTSAAPASVPAAAAAPAVGAVAPAAPAAPIPAAKPAPERPKAKEVGKSFATMLLRVIPEPPADGAPHVAVGAPAGLTDEQIDPLRSPLLQQELPSLAIAFDEAKMRDYLQTTLFGKGRAEYTIESCELDQADYPIGQSALLRYKLTIRNTATGQTSTPLVNARMFPNQLDCVLYVRDRLAPIAALMRGRPEIAPFTAPVGVIEPLNLAVHVFPIDGELPTLINATDNGHMAEVLGEVLNDQSESFEVEQCRVQLVDYARHERCTLRYEIDGRRPGASAPEHQTVYGKVFADQSGALAGRAVDALRAWVVKGSTFKFDMPRVLAWRPDLHLSLHEAIPGEPLIADQLKARLRGKPAKASALSLDEMIDACAKVAAALHSSPIKLGARRTFDDEIGALRRELDPIQQFSPALGERLLETIQQFETYAEQSDPLPLRLCHGDFTHGQLLFAGRDTGLIDFDSICQAEPALDLGQFLTYLKLAGRKGDTATAPALIEQLSERFLNAYIAAMGDQIEDPERLRIRVAVYQAIGSLRRTLRSWQKIKGERLQGAIVQLEEELACLPPLDY